MSDALALYSRVADGFADRLRGVQPDDWNRQSPCEGWRACDVAMHVVGVGLAYLAVAEGSSAPTSMEGWLDDFTRRGRVAVCESGALPAFEAMRARAEAAVVDPELKARVIETQITPLPVEAVIAYVLAGDMLAHTWDLSRATGLPEQVDDSAAAALLTILAPLDEPLRRPFAFKARIDLPEGASDGDRFLSFTGRPAGSIHQYDEINRANTRQALSVD